MKIVIATHNKAKQRDLMQALDPLTGYGYTLHTLQEFGVTQEPEETGKTFEENALLKAKAYAASCGVPAVADDGGLRIDALHGEPGVRSRRWTGKDSTDEELITYALQRMHDIPEGQRSANMCTCLCYYDPETDTDITVTEQIRGRIATTVNPGWTRGYPYRAIFIVDLFNKYYDQLTPAEHAQVNHRLIAANRLISELIRSKRA